MPSPQENSTAEKNRNSRVKSGEWFRHDVGARNDKKILALRKKHGARGVGLYFMLLEFAYENNGVISAGPDDIDTIEYDLRETGIAEFLVSLCEVGLLKGSESTCYTSERIQKELQLRSDKSNAARAAAERSHSKRAKGAKRTQSERTADALPRQDITVQDNTNKTVQEIQIPAYAVGKNKIGQNVFVTTEQYSKLRAKYAESGLGEDYLKRAVDILDGYYAKRVGPKSTKTNRDQYTDDYLVLIGWPLKNVIDEAASAARLKNSRNVGNAGASGAPLPQPLKGTVGQVLSTIRGAR